jgi:nucleoside-diphosphate-sugar epimerase
LAINRDGLGSVELHEADMMVDRAYDNVFAGCSAIFHVAADIGTDPSYGNIDSQRMYDGLFTASRNVLNSVERSGSVKRLIYTSSCAAVMGPAPECYMFTEADWAGAGGRELLEKKWMGKNGKTAWTIEANAYAKGKLDCEIMAYQWGKDKGVDVITCCPNHVLGPLLCKAHDSIWQHRLGEIFAGKYSLDMLWGITDVRDVGDSQRRMAECAVATNGSRYILSSPSDGSGWVTAREMVVKLKMLFPSAPHQIGGSKPMTTDRKSGRATSRLAQDELGLRCHIAHDTIKDTIDSLERLGCMKKIFDRMAERRRAEARGKPIAVRTPDRPSEARL